MPDGLPPFCGYPTLAAEALKQQSPNNPPGDARLGLAVLGLRFAVYPPKVGRGGRQSLEKNMCVFCLGQVKQMCACLVFFWIRTPQSCVVFLVVSMEVQKKSSN